MTDQPEPIRKSQLPTTPPPEWEITTVGGKDSAVVRRRVTFGDWEPVLPNHWADEPTAAVRDGARQTGQQPRPAALGITTEQALAGAHALGAVLSTAQPSGAQPTTAAPDPTTADDPTPLRWGLDDVFHNDDDTVTICLSGPDGEPYWLGLEPERAQALRDDLAEPDVSQRATAPLTAAERKFLHFALDQAAEELSLGDGFTADDQAALAHLRLLAGKDER
ncbi:hypothetical protein PUR59_04300 [Streptomyces sp. SP18ES09]|uniref:hypothetical protein n=1 Tax=Streptomyces sp. SP18ES09 TaxID=3002532 RepID=UPI002E78CC65|nr:hypothetical protein [Streptomyces sp. SP18ES09]MEE1814242.1 hypothetical protein [Streptomyces sp. SP18ES09]